jgi:ubiquinone/menaquinone biosynthesis C-methylase UbiE
MIHNGNLYTNLSAYYDLFCSDVDYAEQCAFTSRIFECFAQTDGRQYLDLACGTGAHIQIMQSLGFTATGLDNSAEMLAQAAKRCPDAAFILSDMSAFETAYRYDLITCFLYSIHYSHPVSVLKQTLKRVYDALQPGGVFIFNAVDIKGITNRHVVTSHAVAENSLLTFVSGWCYQGVGETMDLHLSISREPAQGPGNTVQKDCWQDQHVMTALEFNSLSVWLLSIGFESTFLEHDYDCLQLWNGSSFNALVVACKPR